MWLGKIPWEMEIAKRRKGFSSRRSLALSLRHSRGARLAQRFRYTHKQRLVLTELAHLEGNTK